MGKFPFKRPRIISKNFSEMTSSIDGVTKSLNDLVFSYAEKVDRTIQKKHVMMAISSLVLLVVLGSFISPKGKADSTIFYPDTCLGGWVNPNNAQKEPETTSNGDETQFTINNSAILPKNTNAEIYCGNFRGNFDETTKPIKIVVSLALTKGTDIDAIAITATDTLLTIDSSSLLASSTEVLNAPSLLPEFASSTNDVGSSTVYASTTELVVPQVATTTEAEPVAQVNSSSSPSIIEGVLQSVQNTIDAIFFGGGESQTDTVVIPPPQEKIPPIVPETAPEAVPAPPTAEEPTSYFNTIKNSILSLLGERVFAQEEVSTDQNDNSEVSIQEANNAVEINGAATITPIETKEVTSKSNDQDIIIQASSSAKTDTIDVIATSSETLLPATSTELTSSSSLIDFSTTTDIVQSFVASSTEEQDTQNNFLEVLYSFDGVTWISLGELNEISMKYRTFEIPVTASTSWGDMEKLQIKLVSKWHGKETPTVYFDGVKLEVLYENATSHIHPDFARDTILKDEIIDGLRIVTIINYETKEEEVWYMVLEEKNTSLISQIGTSTQEISSSQVASQTEALSQVSLAEIATSSSQAVNLLKKAWKKYIGTRGGLQTNLLVEEIKKQEFEEIREKIIIIPDFSIDTIKKMKGVSSDLVVIQIERNYSTSSNPLLAGQKYDELWLYNIATSSVEKIGSGTSSPSVSVADDSPLGSKGGYIFWLSSQRTMLYAYNIATKSISEKTIPDYNTALGERAEVIFENIPWKVIVSGETFSFYSEETGEVFSDDDSSLSEALRRKFNLDAMLDDETLSNLNLQVTQDEVSNEH